MNNSENLYKEKTKMSYEPTNWKTGDVVTSAKLNKIEGGVSEVSEAYEPTVWQTGDVVTSAKLNKIEQALADATAESWVTVFDDAVITTANPGAPFARASITPSETITDDNIRVEFNGEVYECQRVTVPGGSYAYGGINSATGDLDFSEYPFMVGTINNAYSILTEQAGTFSVKIEIPQGGSDLSTANVTITNNTGMTLSCGIPCADTFSSYGFGITATLDLPEGETPYLVPLYESHAFLYIDCDTEQVDVELTGNIILHPTDPVFIVTGDGTITLGSK